MRIELSDEYIKELIECPKTVVEPPKRVVTREKNRRQSLTLQAQNLDARFRVFTRQLVALDENFSIGLVLLEPRLILLRYNGIHAPHTNPDGTQIPRGPHIHMLDNATLKDGVTKPEVAYPTNRYYTFEQAKLCFVNDTNIQDWRRFWPQLDKQTNMQGKLFELPSQNGT